MKKRDVKFAEKVFTNFALKSVQPDAYTYTHMINICARYGNVDRAKFFFDDMIAQGVAPNVVTYTSFIKGLVMWGRMDDAVVALKGMKQNKVAPNFRTYSTILRGCLKDGNVDLAVELYVNIFIYNHYTYSLYCCLVLILLKFQRGKEGKGCAIGCHLLRLRYDV